MMYLEHGEPRYPIYQGTLAMPCAPSTVRVPKEPYPKHYRGRLARALLQRNGFLDSLVAEGRFDLGESHYVTLDIRDFGLIVLPLGPEMDGCLSAVSALVGTSPCPGVLQLDGSGLHVSSPHLDGVMAQVSRDVAREMGLADVLLQVAQVVVVDAGWGLPPLPPVPCEGRLGTVIVQLPTFFAGGMMTIRPNDISRQGPGSVYTPGLHSGLGPCYSWVLFGDDSHYTLDTVLGGRCVHMVCWVLPISDGVPPSVGPLAALDDATMALEEWLSEVSGATSNLPAPMVGGRPNVPQKGVAQPPRAFFCPLTPMAKPPQPLIGTDNALVELLTDAATRLGLPVQLCTMELPPAPPGEPTPAWIRAPGLSDQPLMIGQDARHVLLMLPSNLDTQGKVLKLPKWQTCPGVVVWQPSGYAETMIEGGMPSYGASELCHCVEQHLQQEGGQGAPCLPYGIQSLETWGLMLAGKATKDAACDHAFAKALCHLLAAAESRDVADELLKFCWPSMRYEPEMADVVEALGNRFGWQHVTERLITMITGEEAIASVGVISTLFAAKRIALQHTALAASPALSGSLPTQNPEPVAFLLLVASQAVDAFLAGKTCGLMDEDPSTSIEDSSDMSTIDDEEVGDDASEDDQLVAICGHRLAEFGALASFIVRDVAPLDVGEAQRLMLRLFRGVCEDTALFPFRYFFLPLLRHQQQWQPWAKQKSLPSVDVLALTLLTDTVDHMALECESELLDAVAKHILPHVQRRVFGPHIRNALTNSQRRPFPRAVCLQMLDKLFVHQYQGDNAEALRKEFKYSCMQIWMGLSSRMSKVTEAEESRSCAKEVVTILPFLWTCCKGQLKAEITKGLPSATSEGVSCVEQSASVTFGVALQVITELYAKLKRGSHGEALEEVWVLLARAALARLSQACSVEHELCASDVCVAILSVVYKIGLPSTETSKLLLALVRASKGLNALGTGVISAVAAVLRADEGAKLYPPFYLLTGLLSQLEKVLKDIECHTVKTLKVITTCQCKDCAFINGFLRGSEQQTTLANMPRKSGRRQHVVRMMEQSRLADDGTTWRGHNLTKGIVITKAPGTTLTLRAQSVLGEAIRLKAALSEIEEAVASASDHPAWAKLPPPDEGLKAEYTQLAILWVAEIRCAVLDIHVPDDLNRLRDTAGGIRTGDVFSHSLPAEPTSSGPSSSPPTGVAPTTGASGDAVESTAPSSESKSTESANQLPTDGASSPRSEGPQGTRDTSICANAALSPRPLPAGDSTVSSSIAEAVKPASATRKRRFTALFSAASPVKPSTSGDADGAGVVPKRHEQAEPGGSMSTDMGISLPAPAGLPVNGATQHEPPPLSSPSSAAAPAGHGNSVARQPEVISAPTSAWSQVPSSASSHQTSSAAPGLAQSTVKALSTLFNRTAKGRRTKQAIFINKVATPSPSLPSGSSRPILP